MFSVSALSAKLYMNGGVELSVNIGSVRVFKNVECSKEQALKPLEEAAEAFAQWQRRENHSDKYDADIELIETDLLDEVADCIQACVNLAASLGVDNMHPWMNRCEKRNEDRNRY